jgi:hypothetical protein
MTVATELVLVAALWVSFGAVCAAGYACIWSARPKLRWVAAWPILNASMLLAQTPPPWLAPAPRDVAHRARVRELSRRR